MNRLFKGLGALLAITAILVGMPLVLIYFAGNPVPTADQWHAIVTLVPDYGNQLLFTKVLPLIAWALWTSFAGPFLVELCASIRGIKTRKRIGVFRYQQKYAAGLIGAVALTFAGLSGLSGAVPANAATVQSFSVGSVPARSAVQGPAQQTPVQQQATPTVHDEPVTVQEGDTLFGISERITGDGNNYPEIVEATQGVQPDGQVLTDPDLIQPGWVVNVPLPDPVVPAPASATRPSASQAPTSSGSVDAPTTPYAGTVDAGSGGAGDGSAKVSAPNVAEPTRAPRQASAAEPKDPTPVPVEGSSVEFPLMTAGGIGGILAAGILSALGGLRLQQRRRRRKGERIALPQRGAENLELTMRMVEDPTGVEEIDAALRTLQAWAEDSGSPLPELLAVRVSADQIAFYMATPSMLPAPFESVFDDETVWTVRTGTVRAPERATVSPYPALATIGADAQGGLLLLDLEQIGSLNVTGDEKLARGMLNALAGEFARNPWSDNIRVTLVGMEWNLPPGLDRYRFRQVLDVPALVRNLRADLEDRREALDSYGVSGVLEARSRATELESWAPHVVFMAEMPLGSIRQELAELVTRMPRFGIATIGQGGELVAGATIQVASDMSAEYCSGGVVPPLPFRPQILAGDELALLLDLFATTQQPAQLADLPLEHAIAAGQMSSDGDEGAALDAEPADEIEAPAVVPAQPVTSVEMVDSGETSVSTVDDEIAGEGAAETVPVPDWPVPYVRVLGPVDVLNVDGKLPGRGAEFLSFLLLQGSPMVPGALLQKKLWPDTFSTDNNNARQLAAQVRVALGNAPDGSPLLPEGRSSGGFPRPQAGMDWLDFCRLIGPDLSMTPNDDLISAIRLVRGQPFDGVSRRKGWWTWRSVLEETMRAAILDAADELTHRALQTGKFSNARLGARIAQSADPLNEAGWRLEIETAMSAGDVHAFNEIVDAMFEVIGVDVDADEETQLLIDEARSRLLG